MTSLTKIMAERNLGEVCYNCGSSEGTELHHIVPLKLGGTNNYSNIAVLCPACHKAAHHGRHINDFKHNPTKEEIKKIAKEKRILKQEKRIAEGLAFMDYTQGKIGLKECRDRIGRPGESSLMGLKSFREFCLIHGIKSVHNNIDSMIAHGETPHCQRIGYIETVDGIVRPLLWKNYY